jgi:hypothetical protein
MRCPLWVISGQTVSRQNLAMSAVVQTQTNAGAAGLSAKCHKGHSWPLAARTQQPKRSYRVGFLWDGIFSAEQGIQAQEQGISLAKTEIIVG